MTKATQPASWGSSQGWFLVSPSLFLSTSRLACMAKSCPVCGFCCVCDHSPPSRLGLAAWVPLLQ